jgi:ATP adenylyltransferase
MAGSDSMRNAHRFAWVTAPNHVRPPRPWDAEIRSYARFGVIGSIGALVRGWLLVIPRVPIPNLRHLSTHDRASLGEIVASLKKNMSSLDGELFIFEHGSSRPASLLACGVEQAHLHMLPLNFDLLEAACHYGKRQEIRFSTPADPSDPWADIPISSEYLMVERLSDGKALIGFPVHPSSQWFRRIIATELGEPDAWNYRKHPKLANLRATHRDFLEAAYG